MSNDRLCQGEAPLAAEETEVFRQAEDADVADGARHGPGRRGDELPDDL